jgi:hypothetical protein
VFSKEPSVIVFIYFYPEGPSDGGQAIFVPYFGLETQIRVSNFKSVNAVDMSSAGFGRMDRWLVNSIESTADVT